jgi:hypothetical protein
MWQSIVKGNAMDARKFQVPDDRLEPALKRIAESDDECAERGIKPYPMVYNRARKDLRAFQRWVNLGLYRIVPWEEYTGKAA